jgi:Zn-dependent protease with chaperone function
MISRAWLFGPVLAIPTVGFAVAEGVQAHLDARLHAALRRQFPGADAAQLARVTLDRLALTERDDPGLRRVVRMYAHLDLLSGAGLAAAAAGLGLLLLIRAAAAAAGGSRMLLLYLFKPGLYVTAAVIIALVLAHAVIAIGAVFFGMTALVGRVHVGLMAAIGLGALGGVTIVARGVFHLVSQAQVVVIGVALTRDDAPRLWGLVERTVGRLGTLIPRSIVVGLDPNFFVTEADVICLSGRLSGRTLYCSLPLARILTIDELESVIGHELAHFRGLDTRYSERFYPIYRGTVTSLAALQKAFGEGVGSIALLPAVAVLGYFLACFAAAERGISRDRELAADRAGAEVTTPTTAAAALVKIHAFSGLWDAVQGAAAKLLGEGKSIINLSKAYADAVSRGATPGALGGIAEKRQGHPTDSHPHLAVRLGSLGVSLDEVSGVALSVRPAEAAIELVAMPEQKEERLSDAFQALLARRMGIDPDPSGEGRARGNRLTARRGPEAAPRSPEVGAE